MTLSVQFAVVGNACIATTTMSTRHSARKGYLHTQTADGVAPREGGGGSSVPAFYLVFFFSQDYLRRQPRGGDW